MTITRTFILAALLLLGSLLPTAVSGIETRMGHGLDPFQSPLGYNSLNAATRRDRKLISNRRKADKIVDAKMAEAEEIKALKKPKAWGIMSESPDKKDEGKHFKKGAKRPMPEWFEGDEMEALFMYNVD
ncbi:hypothetical protein MHU86_18293 [Fragilaria crotonensis]|nr:hypothetical protein MHU86_18293 [Fragilaria crotonensis]